MKTYKVLREKLTNFERKYLGEGMASKATPRDLIGIVGAGIIATGLFGCGVDHSEYNFNGKIGEDQVEFKERQYLSGLDCDDNILTEVKPDGRIIRYVDGAREDLKLEYVDITKNSRTIRYTTADKEVLEEAQKKFNTRIQQILEIKTNEKQQSEINKINQGLENLK